MDFMYDVLSRGPGFRTLDIVDNFSWECPAMEVDTSLPGTQVVRVLECLKGDVRVAEGHRRRQRTRTDQQGN